MHVIALRPLFHFFGGRNLRKENLVIPHLMLIAVHFAFQISLQNNLRVTLFSFCQRWEAGREGQGVKKL